MWRLTPWRYVARARAAVMWAYIVGGAAAHICLGGDILVGGPRLFRFANVACVFVLVVVIPQILYRHYRRRFYKRLTDSDFSLCPNCGYSLQGLPDEHICPECSGPFSREEITVKWKTWVLEVMP